MNCHIHDFEIAPAVTNDPPHANKRVPASNANREQGIWQPSLSRFNSLWAQARRHPQTDVLIR
jgi:hypothetical protein